LVLNKFDTGLLEFTWSTDTTGYHLYLLLISTRLGLDTRFPHVTCSTLFTGFRVFTWFVDLALLTVIILRLEINT
jgi:hypothetical protein